MDGPVRSRSGNRVEKNRSTPQHGLNVSAQFSRRKPVQVGTRSSSATENLFHGAWTGAGRGGCLTRRVRWERRCRVNLDNVVGVTVGQKNTATELVDQQLVFVGTEAGKLVAFRNLVVQGLTPPVLVFVQSKVGLVLDLKPKISDLENFSYFFN